MENYADISKKYLLKNKKRTILTIIGCALVAAILYAGLNSFNNWLLKQRADIRNEADWEILVYNDDKDTAEAIVNEDFVRSAKMGSAYSDAYYWLHETVTSNSLYLNVNNIRKVKKYGEYLHDRYGVEIAYNEYLLDTYLIDYTSEMWIAFVLCIFISYIFAIIGIGIIRNSISISAIERLRDYGEMRCIGATKRQIKSIVFRESLIQESIGVAIGIAVGYPISVLLCYSHHLKMGFNIIPALMIIVCFFFDLYFVVNESCKKVISIQPVDAVRGNYRVKLGKTRKTHSGLWGLIFGVEGDYAYKNVKRNRLRFVKTIAAIAFGIAAVTVVGSTVGYLTEYVKENDIMYGYYQEYEEGAVYPYNTKEEVKASLYSADELRNIQKFKGVKDIGYLYKSIMYMEDAAELYDRMLDQYSFYNMRQNFVGMHYDEDLENVPTYEEIPEEERYITEETYNSKIERDTKRYKEFKEQWSRAYDKNGQLLDYDELCFSDGEHKSPSYFPNFYLTNAAVSIYGYEGEDWDRYKDHLIAGTLDISDQGIVLVNGGKGYYEEDNTYMVFYGLKDYTYTDYQIGDSVTFVDPEELYELVQSELKNAEEYDRKKLQEDKEYKSVINDEIGRGWIVEAARQKLISEGKCKTYIIEGIVDRDVNHVSQGPVFIMPLDKYLAATGSTKDDYTGFQYHVENTLFSDISSDEYSEAVGADLLEYSEPEAIYADGQKYMPNKSDYRWAVMFAGAAKPMIYAALIIFVIVFVNCLNIYNVTMSNLAQRQNEFAQLRAIGMTKRGLFKAVVLEGVIMWVLACVIGLIFGWAVEYMIHHYILFYIIGQGLFINWPAIIAAIVLSFIVLVGAYYFPMKRMRLDVAEELMRSGE